VILRGDSRDSRRKGGAVSGRPLPASRLTGTLAALAISLVALAAAPTIAAADTQAPRAPAKQIHVGPGPVSERLVAGSYRLQFQLTPNRATRTGVVVVSLTQRGRPIAGAHITLRVTMLDMNMGDFTTDLSPTRAGTYMRSFPVVGMSGHWQLRLSVKPREGQQVTFVLDDRMAA